MRSRTMASKTEQQLMMLKLKAESRSKTISLRVSPTISEYLKNRAQKSVGEYIVDLIINDMIKNAPNENSDVKSLDLFEK